MIRRRIGKKFFSVYAFDVESHADEESVRERKTGVWLASFINDESKPLDEANFFYDLDSFLDRLDSMTSAKRKHRKGQKEPKNVMIYVWNFSFEWSFLLPVMLKRGFVFSEKIGEKEEYCFNSLTTKTCSSVWNAKLKFKKDGGIVIFRDLAKIFTGSLKKVAKSMNLETQKGEIDYEKNRRHGYIPTQEEKLYNFKDTRIIIDILLKMNEEDDHEFWSSVSAASYSFKKMLKESYPRARIPMKEYRKKYPLLSDEENEFIHKSVAGGLTYANPLWQFVEIRAPIQHIDYHQSYPSSMASMRDELFPYGTGKYGTGVPPLWRMRRFCIHCKISFDRAKLHSVIKLIGLDFIDDYEIWVWDFELETMRKAYEGLKIEYIDYYEYQCGFLPFREYFKKNYQERLKAKKDGDDFKVFWMKMLNNSVYGKFEENPHSFVFENVIDEDGMIDSIKHEKSEATPGKFTYYPVGACISAYARSRLIEDALRISPDGSKILYMDTDSLFFLDDEETRKNLKKVRVGDKLGDFGFEEPIEEARFTAAKRYKLKLKNGKSEIKAGGFTIDEGTEYDDLNLVDDRLSARTKMRAEGGTLIVKKDKTMKIEDKYKENFLKNGKKVYNVNAQEAH